ncbi:hypothetical protein GCM10020295_40080 [Streptomyces cinereospinus]
MNGHTTGAPNQTGLPVRTRSPASVDSPGSSAGSAGVNANASSSPCWPGVKPTRTGELPWLRTASRYRPRSQPRRRRGTSSVCSSWNSSMCTVVSSTRTDSGCSVGSTRTPRAVSPARTCGERGGASRIVTVSDVPGYRETRAGSTVVQAAQSPTTSRPYASTMSLSLRTVRVVVAVSPGATVTDGMSRPGAPGPEEAAEGVTPAR